MIGSVAKGIGALAKGLGVTFKYFVRKPITVKYPEERREPYLRFRGTHVLRMDDQGRERCVACCLCARVCPANVITIEADEREDHQKYPKKFEIDLGRCIFCGYCVEACPKAAIIMSTGFETADYHREDLIFDKNRLLKAD